MRKNSIGIQVKVEVSLIFDFLIGYVDIFQATHGDGAALEIG